MYIKKLLKAFSLILSLAISGHVIAQQPANATCPDAERLQGDLAKMHQEYNTLTANRDAARKAALKSQIALATNDANAAQTKCNAAAANQSLVGKSFSADHGTDKNAALTAAVNACKASGCGACDANPGHCQSINPDRGARGRGEAPFRCASTCTARAAAPPVSVVGKSFSATHDTDKNAALTSAVNACKAAGCGNCEANPGYCQSINQNRLARGRGEAPFSCTSTCKP